MSMIMPKLFVIENVANLLASTHRAAFNKIMRSLRNIKMDDGSKAYHVYYRLINSKDYGVPQFRSRVYIVGCRADVQTRSFRFPLPVPMRKIENVLMDDAAAPRAKLTATNRKNIVAAEKAILLREKLDPRDVHAVVDAGSGRLNKEKPYMLSMCPTITRSRASAGDYWATWLNRKLNNDDMLRLQGVLPGEVDFGTLSRRQVGALIGNAMTLPVLQAILLEGLRVVGLIP